jgi:hypothetical protein
VTIDRDAIDFGDVAIDTHLNAQLAIRNESSSPVTVVAPAADANLPFHFDLPGFVLSPHDLAKLAVTVDARALGDYSSTAVWVTTSDPNINLPDGCTSMFTASFHVRVVLPDAGTVAAADAGTDAAADAGQDAAADAGTDAAEATAPRARAR